MVSPYFSSHFRHLVIHSSCQIVQVFNEQFFDVVVGALAVALHEYYYLQLQYYIFAHKTIYCVIKLKSPLFGSRSNSSRSTIAIIRELLLEKRTKTLFIMDRMWWPVMGIG